jgi:SAM-dependent methyltransferase
MIATSEERMVTSHDYPEFVARFYDTVYAEVRDGVDNDYYLGLIAASPGPVLEIGVGTGRLFCEALRRGADIEGLDLSPAMIARARAKLPERERHRLHLANAVSAQLDRRYALLLAPFRVLSHVEETADQLRLLDNVHAHLLPGGRFVFDLFVPAPRLLADGMPEHVDFDGEYAPGRRLRRLVSARSDVVSQRTFGRMRFLWDEDGEEREGAWEDGRGCFFRYELEHPIARPRLALESIHGDFQGGALAPDSAEFVVTCRRGSR